jgi:hypothetical protein
MRGLNSPARREVVCDMVLSANPLKQPPRELIYLQETKLASITPLLLSKAAAQRIDGYEFSPAVGTRGGILLGWDSDYIETPNMQCKNYSLITEIKIIMNKSAFQITVVYGPTDDSEKEAFLAELSSSKPSASSPWIVLGDFNLIYEARDKNNLNVNRRLMGRFIHVLDSCEIFEFALQTRKFTWSNERQTPTLVHLDRVFCNKDWDLMYSGFSLHAFSSSLSDHCPLMLCQQNKPMVRDTFRFENFWPRLPGFREIVQQAWHHQYGVGISALNILYLKLQRIAKALKNWSKKLFGNARMELHMANEVIQRLDAAQDNRQLSSDEFILQKDLKNRVLGLAAVERSRRRQASRIT